jgi:hypothetical protein
MRAFCRYVQFFLQQVLLYTTQDTNKLKHTKNTPLNTSGDTYASTHQKTCVSTRQKKAGGASTEQKTHTCSNTPEGTYMCLNTSEDTDVFICIGKHLYLNKSETTYVLTHVLLNTDNTNLLKYIRRHMCSNTPEDTDVLKYNSRYTCNKAPKKTRMCLNTSEDT